MGAGGGEGRGGLIPGSPLSCTLQIPTSIGQTQVEAGQDPVPETEGACTWGQTEPVQYTQPELGLQSGLSDPRSYILSSPTGKCQRPLLASVPPFPHSRLSLSPPSRDPREAGVHKGAPLVLWAIFSSSRASAHRGLLSLCLPSLHRE